MVLLLFLIVFMIDTMPQYRVRAQWREIADLINLTTASFFACEWVLRFYSFRRPKRYLIQPLTIIDVLGIFPGFIKYTTGEVAYFGNVKWLRALQVLRVLRILRLTEYSAELYVTIRTLRRSLMQIAIVMMVIVVVLLTGCFLLFFAENDSLDRTNVKWMRKNQGVEEVSPFQNVFFCLYWGFVTITTVGYGDYTPVSPWGQVIACVTMFVGVFTIVFPTSIISNNFASEWEAFRKAQKIHEQRVLQRQYQGRRRELSRLWSYANQPYNGVDGEDRLESEEAQIGGPLLELPSSARNAVSPSADTSSLNEPSHIGPAEYGRLIDVSKRVERDLGIPGISFGAIDTDNEVNQNLVVSAMYYKLYNEAFTTLCKRMVVRIAKNMHIESASEIAALLEIHAGRESVVHSWPHDDKLSMLEHKLLGYVFDNLKDSVDFGSADSEQGADPERSQPMGSVSGAQSSRSVSGRGHRHGYRFGRRLKSKLAGRLSRETTHQSVHDYMSSEIASERQSPVPQRIPDTNLARCVHLNNMHRSSTQVDLQAGQTAHASGSASSPAIAATALSDSEHRSDQDDERGVSR
ncbi:hypothetical protein GGF49_005556 [Coemansia sp. RSA 1853]|nr:hypothetical protein LPJ76_001871 [Coemansia sp. RSA 638]KAJ2538963.1 hypothetical protein GGF49_005556 [Coemansia sp. RSA 1853]